MTGAWVVELQWTVAGKSEAESDREFLQTFADIMVNRVGATDPVASIRPEEAQLRVAAVLRMLTKSGDITPMGVRMVNQALGIEE